MDITITGKTILDDTAINMALFINLLSANVSETLTGMSSEIRNGNAIKLIPASNLTLTLVHSKNPLTDNVFRLQGGEDKILSGSNGDWIELVKVNGKWYQGNAQIYVAEPTAMTKFIRDIDFRTTGNVTLMRTANTDMHLFLTKVDFIAKTLVKPNVTILNPFVKPTVSMGYNSPNYSEIADNYELDLTEAAAFMANMVNGETPAVTPNTDIVLKKISGGNATTYIGHVRILGFYYKI